MGRRHVAFAYIDFTIPQELDRMFSRHASITHNDMDAFSPYTHTDTHTDTHRHTQTHAHCPSVETGSRYQRVQILMNASVRSLPATG